MRTASYFVKYVFDDVWIWVEKKQIYKCYSVFCFGFSWLWRYSIVWKVSSAMSHLLSWLEINLRTRQDDGYSDKSQRTHSTLPYFCVCVHVHTLSKIFLPITHPTQSWSSTCWSMVFHLAWAAAGVSMPLSLRLECRVWKMLSCCSGCSISSCWSTLLGLGPLQEKNMPGWEQCKKNKK